MSIARQQTNRKKEFKMTNYAKLSKQVTLLQHELMEIDNYSEEAYQLLEQLIDELDYQAEELIEKLIGDLD